MEIIKQADLWWETVYERAFQDKEFYNGHSFSGGYAFKCNQEGNIISNHIKAYQNFINSDKINDYIDMGINEYEIKHKEPAIGLCSCGREVALYGFTNTCDCGRDYNQSGQLLAPREQWGEETGEYLSDILRIR